MSEGPQTEDGFVRIANELFDAILMAPLSKREQTVVLAVIRKTYGFGKKADDITVTQLADITNLQRSHVSEALRDLEAKGVITTEPGTYGRVVSLVKNFKKWRLNERPESGNKDRPKTGRASQIRTRPEMGQERPESGNDASQIGKHGVPNREITRPESGHTIDNPKRQLQKTTPKDSYVGVAVAPTVATWEAYADAYRSRYGVEPMRNAKVNGQLAQFVQRIPASEAPEVARFYVRHNNGYYVRRGHCVDGLLSDAEKLRTEWATDTRMTETKARQTDRTEAAGQVWTKLLQEAEAREA